MWRSLRIRLLLATVVVVLIALGVTALVASRRTAGEFQRYVERRNPFEDRRIGFLLARSYSVNASWEGVQAEIEQLGQAIGKRVIVADPTGKIVGDSDRKLLDKAIDPKWPPPSATMVVEGVPVGVLYVNPVAGPNPIDAAFISSINLSLLYAALIAVLAAVVITFALASRILRPVERLRSAAERMAQGDLSVRVPVDNSDEIGQLAQAFNTMAGSLAQQEQLRRNMVGDVAHELRTPLTNLRGYLEAVRDGLLVPDVALVDNLYEETMLLSRLVADLQDLAQAEAGQLTLTRQPTSLNGLVEQAVAVLRPQADTKGVTLTVELPSGLPPVDVDASRVGQVLRNLLNNALAHTPAGGSVTISAGATEDAVAVAVRDTGSGISPEHLPYVFDRFYRADKSRARQTGGAGLGLAIVKQLVGAHGGAISVDSQPERGSTFTFTLPTWTESSSLSDSAPSPIMPA